MKSKDIRETFLRFFEDRGHKRVQSDSLVPGNDPTLLFTNAGMVQFKPFWVAKDKPFSRATSSQRCLRTIDIDLVGITRRHLTFFEMLGNFSFGDYYQEGAIEYAWEFLTKILRLDPGLLCITVFEKDEKAETLWRRFMPKDRILRFGDEDNYWPPASALKTWVGPNGPCSEIYYDFGVEQCKLAGYSTPCTGPGEHECERFREIWNLVFPGYLHGLDGANPPMPKPGIDTGMGFERIVMVLQGKDNFFETDVFEPLILASKTIMIGREGEEKEDIQRARRIVADHARAATFLVSDGIVPTNEGRGYVLRRIIRRAVRQTALFGEAKPIVSALVPTVVAQMGEAYPEIAGREADIASTIKSEEARFIETLQRGLEELQKERHAGSKVLDGRRAFYLYDTFGFPKELTEDIWVREMKRKLSPGFNEEYARAMEEQQMRARAAWRGSGEKELTELHQNLSRELGPTEFVGYERLSAEGRIRAVLRGSERVKEARAGEAADIVLDVTPFYAESGGQVSDRGGLSAGGATAEVAGVQKLPGGVFLHSIEIKAGVLKEGDRVEGTVDVKRRLATARHHTVTHLLHAALHSIVGRQATQAGSYVGPDRLRFDFMNQKAVEPEKLAQIEATVNEKVLADMPVDAVELSLEEAKKKKVLMLFGEKYGAKVRMLEVKGFSRELCGGTHVKSTAQIGPFIIVSEGAVAAGVRRIEALAGAPAMEYLRERRATVERIAGLLRSPVADVETRVAKLVEGQKTLEQSLRQSKAKLAKQGLTGKAADVERINGVKVLIMEAQAEEPAVLRELADQALAGMQEGIVVLGARKADKCHLLVRISKELSRRIGAPDVIKAAASAVGGSGGGKPEMAQAGGRDPEGLPEALERARAYLGGILKSSA